MYQFQYLINNPQFLDSFLKQQNVMLSIEMFNKFENIYFLKQLIEFQNNLLPNTINQTL